jgi:hypothetical protein
MNAAARLATLTGVALLAVATAHAKDAYPVANVPDIVGACRPSYPEDCPVPPGEKWQAMYRERCALAPQQCTFRPDGTTMRWVGAFKPSPQLVEAVRRVRAERLQGGGAP